MDFLQQNTLKELLDSEFVDMLRFKICTVVLSKVLKKQSLLNYYYTLLSWTLALMERGIYRREAEHLNESFCCLFS